jgi:hypothetical protein
LKSVKVVDSGKEMDFRQTGKLAQEFLRAGRAKMEGVKAVHEEK